MYVYIYIKIYIFLYGYISLKRFFCPKACPPGAAVRAPCIFRAPPCLEHLGITGAAEPPWVPPGRGHGENQLLLPVAFSVGTSQGTNCPARGHLWWPRACRQVVTPAALPLRLNRKQIALDENYAGIFFIRAGLKLWKIYCNSAEPRGNSVCFLSPASLARAALGGCGCRFPPERCDVWVYQVLLHTVFLLGPAGPWLLGLGSCSGVINII